MTCPVCEFQRCACRIETIAHLQRALEAIRSHTSGKPYLHAALRPDGFYIELGGPHARAQVSGLPSMSDALTAVVAAWWDEHGGGS